MKAMHYGAEKESGRAYVRRIWAEAPDDDEGLDVLEVVNGPATGSWRVSNGALVQVVGGEAADRLRRMQRDAIRSLRGRSGPL